ncbi:MAG TPA: IS21 family transposase, partial [Acidimicrobiales bacterium]|nr:IS21 family transposase [Acidimicrobiales bacterium]
VETACRELCDEVNARPHRVTRRVPAEMLLEEQPRLHRLPSEPYTLAFGESRIVGRATPMVDVGWCQYSVPHELRGEQVWVREHGEEIVIVHVGRAGACEVARHRRTTPGTPRIDDRHFPPQSAGPLRRTAKATSTAEAEFLSIGLGAHRWLSEAGSVGAVRVRAKMAQAVALAKLVGVRRVDWALGHAAVLQRFDDGDLESILDHHDRAASGPQHRSSEAASLQTGTAAWDGFGQ